MGDACKPPWWPLWGDGHDCKASKLGYPAYVEARCSRCQLIRIGLWPGGYTYERASPSSAAPEGGK